MYRRSIDASLEVKRLLNPAHRVDAFRTARDWSYQCQRFSGPGFLLTGDAAGFVDPLFSSGLFLALNGASLAAKTMTRVLAEPHREKEFLSIYDTVYKRFLGVVLSFTHYFYDASRNRMAYWARAQALVDPRQAMTARRDFIFLISGLSGVHNIMDLEPQRALAELERSTPPAR
jgi:clorobiocin biosynthesis protein Clo-hal